MGFFSLTFKKRCSNLFPKDFGHGCGVKKTKKTKKTKNKKVSNEAPSYIS
jgi:hypothetical protein